MEIAKENYRDTLDTISITRYQPELLTLLDICICEDIDICIYLYIAIEFYLEILYTIRTQSALTGVPT